MSWNGTVRCSICYRTGHNKSGCPQVAEEYKEFQDILAKYNDRNPDKPDIEEDQYIGWALKERIGLRYQHIRSRDIFIDKKRKNTSRRCTYCGEIGHNRRTCAPLKNHINQLAEASAKYHAKVAKAFELHGAYVGALIQFKVEEYDYNKCEWIKEDRMGIISSLNLKSYTVMKYLFDDYQNHRSITVSGTNGKQHHIQPQLPKNVKEELLIGNSWSSRSNYVLLSSKDTPVPPHTFDLKEEKRFIKEYLKDIDRQRVDLNFENKIKTLRGDS